MARSIEWLTVSLTCFAMACSSASTGGEGDAGSAKSTDDGGASTSSSGGGSSGGADGAAPGSGPVTNGCAGYRSGSSSATCDSCISKECCATTPACAGSTPDGGAEAGASSECNTVVQIANCLTQCAKANAGNGGVFACQQSCPGSDEDSLEALDIYECLSLDCASQCPGN